MKARRIDAKTLLVPCRAEGPDGMVGDALVAITRADDPDTYDRYAAVVDSAPGGGDTPADTASDGRREQGDRDG